MSPYRSRDNIADDDFAQLPLVGLFERRVRAEPKLVAFRYKRRGIWVEQTWRGYSEEVSIVAAALSARGVSAGDRVAVLSNAVPEWLYCDLAVQSVGGLAFGIYVTSPPDDVAFMLEDAGVDVVVLEDEEQYDKLVEAEAVAGRRLVQLAVVIDPEGVETAGDDRVLSYSALRAEGQARLRAGPLKRPSLTPVAANSIFYTSGTTGRPKGAVHSTTSIIEGWGRVMAAVRPGPADRTVAYMPLASIAERWPTVYMPILYGTVPHISDSPSRVEEAIYEIAPTLLIGTPRMWEHLAARIAFDLGRADPVKRVVFRALSAVSRHVGELGDGTSARRRRLSAAASWMAGRRLLRQFGLHNLRHVLTGGAPLSSDVVRLWSTWGIDLREMYAMTECGIVAAQTGGPMRPGEAGAVLEDITVHFDLDGEMLVRSKGNFLGYWNNLAATSAVLDGEGFFHTGDLGELVDHDGTHHLRVIDRQGNIMTMADGRRIPPSELENVLKFSPFVREVVVIGEGRETLLALVEIEFDTVAEWARAQSITYTSFRSLVEKPAIRALFERELDVANKMLVSRGLPPVADFRLLPRELDPETGSEVTATRKIRRRVLIREFSDLVEQMDGSSAPHTSVSA